VYLKVLLVGKGGREHAIAWKISKSPNLSKLYLWPGNPAMDFLGCSVEIHREANMRELATWAEKEGIDLVVCGPEAPLTEGLADEMHKFAIPVFGPQKAAALLESSKIFAKEVMQAAGIPTASYHVANSESQCRSLAEAMLQKVGGVVLKASGLAAGKGVFVCKGLADIELGLRHLYHTDMREAAEVVVVEEILHGRECSYFTFVGPEDSCGLGFAVDYKRLKDNDMGPNTGGMGSYTPVDWLPSDAAELVEKVVVTPLMSELKKRGITYVGCLYVGLMWRPGVGPQVVEFNVRLGDPEAQILAVYDDRDWLRMMALSAGVSTLKVIAIQERVVLHKDRVVGVVLASDSYPFGKDAGSVGKIPTNVFSNDDREVPCVFGASITREGVEGIQTSSGRVLCIVARASSFKAARDLAYKKVNEIKEIWPSCQFRQDIGLHAEVPL